MDIQKQTITKEAAKASSNQSTFKEWSRKCKTTVTEAVIPEAEFVDEETSSTSLVTAGVGNFSNALTISNANMAVKSVNANRIMGEVSEYVNYERAEQMTNDLLAEGLIDSLMMVTDVNGEEHNIAILLLKQNSTTILDMVETDVVGATGELSHSNYFDATYKTLLRDTEEYKIIFHINEVTSILDYLWMNEHATNKKFLLQALADNIAISGMTNSDVTKVIEQLVKIEFLPLANDFRSAIKKAKWRNKRFSNKIPEYELEALYILQGYAVVNDNGVVKFIDLNAERYRTITKVNLTLLFANQKIEVVDASTGKVAMVNPVTLYLESKHRKEYDGVAFDPSNKLDPSIYNLFRGFKLPAIEDVARIVKFKKFVRTIICNANEQTYKIVWSFFAQMFQRPWEKKGTCLIMLSVEGSGKGILMDVMGKLMGDYYMSSTDHKRITSPFNKHLEKIILFYANEAKFTDSALTANKLKNIITETAATSEVKGGDTYAASNYTHLVIDGNDGDPVEQNENSRRFITVHVDESKVGNLDYYAEIIEEIETDGFHEAMMHEMMTFDYSEYEHFLRRPPKEEITEEQIRERFSKIDNWWHYCLEEGHIPHADYSVAYDGTLSITHEEMYGSIKEYTRVNGSGMKGMTSTEFRNTFKEQILKDLHMDKFHRPTIKGVKQARQYLYAPLGLQVTHFQALKKINNIEYNGEEWSA